MAFLKILKDDIFFNSISILSLDLGLNLKSYMDLFINLEVIYV